MREYLKMSDVFKGEVKAKYLDGEAIDELVYGEGCGTNWAIEDSEYWIATTYEHAGYAAHAINSHDELVAEVERLRDALQDAYLDGCHYGWGMSSEGYNAEYGGPNDGRLHNQFIESYSGEPYISE